MAEPKIYVCGSIAMDRIMIFSESFEQLIQPDKLDVLSISVLADSLELARGGVGANIAFAIARLGDRPYLIGSVGFDGKEYLEELARSGIDTGLVHKSKLPTASFQVLTDRHHNQVGGFYPGAMSDAASLHVPEGMAKDDIFCLSAHDPRSMRMQADECFRGGFRLCFDPGQQVNNVSGEDLRSGIEAAELLVVNAYEFDVLCKKTGYSSQDLSAKLKLVVVTNGGNGSVMTGTSVNGKLTINASKPSSVMDPTGAGDAYRAGLLFGYVRQWDPQRCGQLASVVASLIIEHPGTRYDFSIREVMDRYLASYGEALGLNA